MTPPISLRALLEAEARATPAAPLTISRYSHGGGRVFLENDSSGRLLVADFYEEVDRECWIAARNAARPLCEALQEAIAALEKIADPVGVIETMNQAVAETALAKIRLKVAP